MTTNLRWKPALAVAAMLCAAQASAQVTLYEHDGFRGRAFRADRPVWNLQRFGFNDQASSVVVERGRWEVCEDARFEGRCVVLRRGSYDSVRRMGLNDRISSLRPVDGRRASAEGRDEPEPLAAPTYEWRQRPNERLFEVPVRSARAVMGPPEQRCWVERERLSQSHPDINVPGAVIGGVVGGILGHQVGGGSGRDLATVGGAVGGAALGANVDRFRDRDTGRDVQRCENVAGAAPQYWDVTYLFRGVEHHVQMNAAPGSTIRVNGNGEPRM